jgi:predicted transcriptional regulator
MDTKLLSKAIADLNSAGYTDGDIAKQAGTTQPTIYRIKNNQQNPRFSIGQAILDLRKRVCS